jgi:putative sigma-54 modulation protein
LQVIFTQERHRRIVEAILKANSLSITGQEEAADFFSSIDAVVDNLERQLKKQKNRNKKQKESQEDRLWRIRTEEGAEENSEPQVIVSRNVYAKPMSLEEAVMQMKLSDNEFIVFMDSSTEKINVLYRRNDGNFGLIEPGIS